MAERLDDRQALRSALRARQMVRAGPDGVHERFELGNRMLALGVADADDDTALWGWLWRFDALVMMGRLDEAEAELPRMRLVAERGRRPIARWHYLRDKAVIDIARGRFEDAITALDQSLALVESRAREHLSLLGQPITVLTVIGGLTGRADRHLRADARGVRPVPAAFRQRHARRELPASGRSRARPPALHGGAPARPGARHVGADRVLRLRRGSGRARTAGVPHLRRDGDAGPPGRVRHRRRRRPGVHRIRADLPRHRAAATGRLDDAVRELRLAVDANDRAGTPPFAALARFELAKVLARARPGPGARW